MTERYSWFLSDRGKKSNEEKKKFVYKYWHDIYPKLSKRKLLKQIVKDTRLNCYDLGGARGARGAYDRFVENRKTRKAEKAEEERQQLSFVEMYWMDLKDEADEYGVNLLEFMQNQFMQNLYYVECWDKAVEMFTDRLYGQIAHIPNFMMKKEADIKKLIFAIFGKEEELIFNDGGYFGDTFTKYLLDGLAEVQRTALTNEVICEGPCAQLKYRRKKLPGGERSHRNICACLRALDNTWYKCPSDKCGSAGIR